LRHINPTLQNKNNQKRKQIPLNPRKRKETSKIIEIIKRSPKKSSLIGISGIRVLIKRRRKRIKIKKKIRKGIYTSLNLENLVQDLAPQEKKKLRKKKMLMDIIHTPNQPKLMILIKKEK